MYSNHCFFGRIIVTELVSKQSIIKIFIDEKYNPCSYNLEEIKKEVEMLYSINKSTMLDSDVRKNFKSKLIDYVNNMLKDGKFELFDTISSII